MTCVISVTGVVRPPITVDDDINNCQMVIDVLSADVIKDDLSHIRGVDIVNSDIQSIDNMIDIFTFLYECAIRQKECDPLLDTDGEIISFLRYSVVLLYVSLLMAFLFSSYTLRSVHYPLVMTHCLHYLSLSDLIQDSIQD